jgi:hypothetical protein
MKCECKWIDDKGNDTPDSNEAIALAVCYNPVSFGEKGSDPFPICLEHAQRKSRWWKLLPLPGVELSDCHLMVQRDHHGFPKVVTDVVIESVKKSFPDQAREILETVKWDGLNGCYFFERWGMYVGIEKDGYIHT